MEGLFDLIQNQVPWLIHYKYLFLFVGATVEGFNVLILGGFLVSVGAVAFIPTVIVFILGDFINGYVWYGIGYFAGAKPIDKWIRKDERGKKIIEQVEKYFHKYSGRALILTRLTLSLTIATLIMAGSLKYNFKRFSLYNAIGAAGWVLITMGVGLFFGQSYKILFDYLANMTLALLILAGAIALAYFIRWLFKSAFIKSLMLNERMKEFGDRFRQGIDKFFSNGSDEPKK